MRTVLCPTLGSPEELELQDVPSPKIVPGTARIRVRAAGVNFADSLLIKGTYQLRPNLPFAPGLEIAGVVEETSGPEVRFEVGDRVMGVLDYGGFSEEVIVRAGDLWKMPDSMDFDQAAAFPIVYGTSELGISKKLKIKTGETLLVNAAASGVGLAAVELGKIMGAKVIASAGSNEKLRIASDVGADAVINYKREDMKEGVKALTDGEGVDAVFDPVGGDIFEVSLRSLRPGGRILIVGFASGTVPKIPSNILLVKNISAIGYYWGAYRTMDPDLIDQSFTMLFQWFSEKKLLPRISHHFALEDAKSAIYTLINREARGKVVLLV